MTNEYSKHLAAQQEVAQDNLKQLAISIAVCKMPAGPWDESTLVKNSDEIAKAIAAAPESAWTRWEDRKPTPEDGVIVGRDCLGYFHLATHLIGSKHQMWISDWMSVPFNVTSSGVQQR